MARTSMLHVRIDETVKTRAAESLAKVTLENAVTFMLDQRYLVEEDKKLKLGPASPDVAASKQFAEEIRRYLRHP